MNGTIGTRYVKNRCQGESQKYSGVMSIANGQSRLTRRKELIYRD
jgi:hypothetical protein